MEPTTPVARQIIRYGRRMVAAGLTAGSGGNLSVRTGDRVAITPSGLAYEAIRVEDVAVADMTGRQLAGRLAPSSELTFHLALYAHRRDIAAVVHTHSPYATTLACLNWELPAVHYLVGFAGLKVPLAPYATFGTPELAAAVVAAIGGGNAVLMANHGLVAVGRDLAAAFNVAEEVEFCARIYCQCRSVGDPVILPGTEMARIVERFKTYGQTRERDSDEDLQR